MINVIVPIVEQPEKFSEFVEKHANEKTKFFVGVLENLRDKFSAYSKNIEIHTFSKKTKKEEIINSLHSSKISQSNAFKPYFLNALYNGFSRSSCR